VRWSRSFERWRCQAQRIHHCQDEGCCTFRRRLERVWRKKHLLCSINFETRDHVRTDQLLVSTRGWVRSLPNHTRRNLCYDREISSKLGLPRIQRTKRQDCQVGHLQGRTIVWYCFTFTFEFEQDHLHVTHDDRINQEDHWCRHKRTKWLTRRLRSIHGLEDQTKVTWKVQHQGRMDPPLRTNQHYQRSRIRRLRSPHIVR